MYSKISNNFFYSKESKSILNLTQQAITLLILHNLYVSTNFKKIANTSINNLLQECNYYNNTTNVNKFKNILQILKDNNIIDYNFDIKQIKKNDLIKIDTQNLFTATQNYFFVVDEEELTILNKVDNKKNKRNNCMLVYYYLKARVNKSIATTHTTFQTNETIEHYCNISKADVYVKELEELDLISVLRNYVKEIENTYSITNCCNIYLINNLVEKEYREEELKSGLSVYKNYVKEIHNVNKKQVRFYNNNNRVNKKAELQKQLKGYKGLLAKYNKQNKTQKYINKVQEQIKQLEEEIQRITEIESNSENDIKDYNCYEDEELEVWGEDINI